MASSCADHSLGIKPISPNKNSFSRFFHLSSYSRLDVYDAVGGPISAFTTMNRFTGALLVLGLLATPTFSQSLEVRDADIDASLIVRLAERVFVPPALEDRGISLKRDDVTGSWSLRALTCPDNTITCGSARATKACCAKGYNCASRYYAWACCPTSKCLPS